MFISVENENGVSINYGMLAKYTLGDVCYIALVPVDENMEPVNADVALYIYTENAETGGIELYEIEDEDEYTAASNAFQMVIREVI